MTRPQMITTAERVRRFCAALAPGEYSTEYLRAAYNSAQTARAALSCAEISAYVRCAGLIRISDRKNRISLYKKE